MFLLKKFLSRIFFPVALCCELLIVGMFLLWSSKRQKMGKCLVCMGTLLLLLPSNALISDLLLSPLESKYPLLADPSSLNDDSQAPIRWVAVLGGGITKHARFIEGVRIQKTLPSSKMLLSVGEGDDAVASDAIEMAGKMGLRREDLIIISDVRDTRGEVQQMRQTIGADRFVLVTSASHMPRAMALFERVGMNPLPAPTEYLITSKSSYGYVFPSAHSLYASERAIYEYLGLLWLHLAD